MECSDAREFVSARLDGEVPGVGSELVDDHLSGCAACRAWQPAAQDVVRRARLSGATLDHDLTSHILARLEAVPLPAGRRTRKLVNQRVLLLIVALAQFAITIPLLLLGHTEEGGRHVAHELGSFDLALAVAFLVGAVRPRLSGGLAWPCGIAATGLLITALVDVVTGHQPGIDEAQHLIAVVGALLLFWGTRLWGTAPAGTLRQPRAASPAAADPVPAAAAAPSARVRNAA